MTSLFYSGFRGANDTHPTTYGGWMCSKILSGSSMVLAYLAEITFLGFSEVQQRCTCTVGNGI